MGVVFATTYSIPINAQPNNPTLAQPPATESRTTGRTKEPVEAFAGQLAVFLGHEADLTSAVFSPDGKQILTASEDKTVRLWDSNGNLLTVLRGHEREVRRAMFSPNGRQILTISEYESTRLWDTQGNLLAVFRGVEGQDNITNAVFSPDGRQILTISRLTNQAGLGHKFRLWDTKGNLLVEFQGRQDRRRRSGGLIFSNAIFSPDGGQILTVDLYGVVCLWNSNGNLLKEFQGHQDRVISAEFSPDASQILTGSSDKTARLWDRQGNVLAEFQGHEEGVYRAIFSPDGNQILTASSDTARVWDIKGNLLAQFQGHEIYSWSVQGFSPDGRHILTSSRDGTARLWDTKGNLLAILRGHDSVGAVAAVFSPDGRQILTFGWDKFARLWDVSAAITAESEQRVATTTLLESVSENNAQLAIFRGHKSYVTSAVFSPDGRQILTASRDETARLWDLKGNLLAEFKGHEEGIYRARFSPDGRQILTTNGENIRLWDTKGNLLSVLQGHNRINAVFSPDGSKILPSDCLCYPVSLWDSQGNLLTELRVPKKVEDEEEWQWIVNSAAFSPDGNQILTASEDRIARLWDTKGNLLAEFPLGHEKAVNSVVFSPDGRQFLTASNDETARLWDLKGNLLAEFRGHKERLESAVFSPDGSQILTKSLDDTARLWDLKGNFLTEFRVDERHLRSAIFSPDGRQILMTSSDTFGPGIARLWDLKGNLLAVFRGHEGTTHSAVFSPDGRQILTVGDDGTARLWDVSVAMAAQAKQMAALQTFQESLSKNNAQLAELQENEEVQRAVFSPDGRHILTTTEKIVHLWDNKGNLLSEFQVPKERVSRPVFSPDGRHILAVGDETAYLWDIKGNILAKFQGHKGSVTRAVFSPDGGQILTASIDSTARLWDTKGNLLAEFRGHEYEVINPVFSPDGSQILTASFDKTARLWDTKGNLLAVFRHEDAVINAVFSPDGHHILTASDYSYGYARLWDTKGNLLAEFRGQKDVEKGTASHRSAEFSSDGQQILITSGDRLSRLWDIKGNLLAIFRDHDSSVNSTVFSPDGRQILTASEDKTARLWDNKGNLLAIFRGHEDGINNAEFSPNGRQILTASQDRTARIWDIAAGIKVSAAEVAYIKGNQLFSQETIESRQLALTKLEEALELYRAEQNSAQAALTLLSMGKIHADLGQFQSALDSYNQALPLSQQAGSKKEEADILNSLGQLYTELAEPKAALDYYNQALPLFYQLNDQKAVAATLNNIGSIQATSQQWQNDALKSYNKALTISRPAGTLDAEASALMGIGNIYITSNEWATALNAYNQALLISQHLNDKVKETAILNQMGKIYAALGQEPAAVESYNQALSLSRQLGYKTEEANILYNQAILSRQQNRLTVAKSEIETALNIIENLRTQIASQDLRQSYFAGNQDYYQFYIDLLMQLHQQDPNKGYDAEALHISERARARSLLELLTEATADIRAGVEPQLLESEQSLQPQLNALDHQKYQLVSGSYTQTELEEIQQKIASTLAQLDQLKAKIRISSPRYADLKYPEPLTLQEIQQQVLDEETVLLEYALSEKQSYLWVVTKNSLTSYILPRQGEIEAAAETFREAVTINSGRNIEAGLPLSKMLLEPAASQLENKRLLIVGDGALQTIPFAALPLPASPNTPLLVQNEIVTLPSASTVAIQRRQLENRPIANKTLAVIADPVFNLNDERVTGIPAQPTASINNSALTRATRNLGIGEGGVVLDRLKFTRTEAEKILALLPDAQRLQALDFDASRQVATDPNLAQYQMIHLATHGLLDPVNPELSGVVLSLFDQQGKSQDGFLRLHDIFNLNLPAELVVLSACQTGLGEAVKGEGLVGLTRGFMYAGARRVVVSLWSVNDVATSELMTKFYQKMINEGQNPVKALRAAQLEMWNSGQWQSPYYWAAFTVQGDWR
ncbi:CHAT domain-containing protein [Microcoleus sp. FACHB-672]|nr:CHAT domain-containing protein [Microcoleus sp. FACHB-672]